MENHELSHWLGHAVSLGAIIGTIAGYLPAIAALVAIIWYLVQIYESKTAQWWFVGWRERRIARHKAAMLKLEAKISAAKKQHERPDLDA